MTTGKTHRTMSETTQPGTALAVAQQQQQAVQSLYANQNTFVTGQRIAQALAASSIVPESYQNNLPNCMIALELANRIGTSPLLVMQNMHVIKGRPNWSSTFLIASINSCGRFSPLRYRIELLGRKDVEYTYNDWVNGTKSVKTGKVAIDDVSCIAYATELATGEVLEGPAVTVEMAVREGWYTKSDSKWKTMPDLMLRYRSAAFFVRLYAPEIAMGMHTQDEAEDFEYRVVDERPSSPKNGNLSLDSLRGSRVGDTQATVVSAQNAADNGNVTKSFAVEQRIPEAESVAEAEPLPNIASVQTRTADQELI